MLQVQHCETTLAGMPVGGYPPTAPKLATVFKVTRVPARKPRRSSANFTTHLRGPSAARATSGRGHLPTSGWLKDNAARYGIVRRNG